MSGRPAILHVGDTLYWIIRVYNSSGALVDADAAPTVNVYKNGVDTADAVTVSKRAATTGIYDCQYNPAGEAEGDVFSIEESLQITATDYENSWEFTVVAVETGGGGSGVGSRVVLITVQNDSAALIPSAKVTIQDSDGNSLGIFQPTNGSGVATFNLDDGDYKAIVESLSGYETHVAESFTVDEDNEAVTLTITASVIAGSSAPQSTLVVNCTDESGDPETGVEVQMRMTKVPSSGTGYAYDSTIQTATSDGSGVAQLVGVRLGTYQVKRGDSKQWHEITLADAATTSAPSFIGSP